VLQRCNKTNGPKNLEEDYLIIRNYDELTIVILKILNDSANEVKKRLYKATRIRSLEDTITYICGGKNLKRNESKMS